MTVLCTCELIKDFIYGLVENFYAELLRKKVLGFIEHVFRTHTLMFKEGQYANSL
jgi:hypothetical protein